MIVLCIEGCHGCGKTQLCEEFRANGFVVQDEAFIDMPTYALRPQSLMMETLWICNWFSRVLQREDELRREQGTTDRVVLVADRSPFSAVFYCDRAGGKLLEPVIREQIKELRRMAGIEIFTVVLRVDREVLWERIQARLLIEPERAALKEDKREWMDQVADFYDTFPWDYSLDNSKDSMRSLLGLMNQLIEIVSSKSEEFRAVMIAHRSSRASECSTESEEDSKKKKNHPSNRNPLQKVDLNRLQPVN